MEDHYVEDLPSDIVKSILQDKYNPKYLYQLVTDRDGSYITAFDKTTGERISVVEGDPDDMKLETEDVELIHEDMDNLEANNFTDFRLGWRVILVVLVFLVWIAVLVGGFFLLRRSQIGI